MAIALTVACSDDDGATEKTDVAVTDNQATNDGGRADGATPGVVEYVLGVDFELGVEARAPRLADLDGDDFADLVVVHQFSDQVKVLRGRGDGFFDETTLNVERAAYAAPADFDGDGKGDLALAVDGEPRVVIVSDLLGAATTSELTLLDFPDDVAAADFDGDGDPDLAVSIAGTLNDPSTSVAIFLNEETGFGEPALVEVGLQPRQLRVGDTDGDGDLDIVALLGTTAAVVLPNDGTGSFAASAPFSTGDGVLDATLIDAEMNDSLDLAAADLSADAINLALDVPAGDAETFREVPAPFGITSFHGNDDALLDVAATSVDDASVVGMLSNDEGKFVKASFGTIDGAVRLGGLTAADFDGDGVDDFAVVERQREPENGRLHFLLSRGLPTR